MLFRLVILNGPMSGKRVTVPETAMTIGRGEGCTLALEDAEAACAHVELRMDSGALHLRDLGSMTVTLVNQVETRQCRLKHGDVIEVGRTRLLVEAHVQAEVPAAPGGRSPARRPARTFALAAAALVFAVAAFGVIRTRIGDDGRQAGDPRAVIAEARARLGVDSRVAEEPEEEREAPSTGELPPPEVRPVDAGDDNVLGEELRLLRGDIERIRDALSTLTEARSAETEHVAAATSDPQIEAARAMLDHATVAMGEGRLGEAERLLEGLHVFLPEFIPGLEARAHLFEQRGQLDRALELWARVETHADEEPERDHARLEQERLARRLREIEAESASVHIATLQQRKFPERDGIAEMRTVTVGLMPESPFLRPDPSTVSVEVAFYEMELPQGGIFPSRRVPPVRLVPEGDWPPGEAKSLVATYRVDEIRPETGPSPGLGPPRAYVGYRVRLFVRGHLKSEMYRPVTLAELPQAEEASVRMDP